MKLPGVMGVLVSMMVVSIVDAHICGRDAAVFSPYDAVGRLTGIDYPNGVATTNVWDLADRLTEFRHSKTGALVLRRLGYDDVDRPIREEIDAGAIPKPTGQSWRQETCDLADRVISAFGKIEGVPATWSYACDAAGNLLDASRTMTGTVATVSYSYDLAGRMVAITNGTAVESYAYDAGGSPVKRVKDAAARYYALDYADGFKRPLAELDSAGAIVRRYVWAGAMLLAVVESNGVVRYAHSDGQGSVLALTDSSGAVTDQFAYGPYGEPWARTGTNDLPFRWLGGSGVVYAGDGLYLTYHRLYDANLKRFLQSDPKGIAGGVNLYAYGNLSPLVYVDPLGLCAERGIPSFTSSFGSEQFRMAATGWYGGTGIRLNTAQRVIAGAWGAVQAAAEVLTFGALGGANSIGTRSVVASGSKLTALERAYVGGAYGALRSPVAHSVSAGHLPTLLSESGMASGYLSSSQRLALLSKYGQTSRQLLLHGQVLAPRGTMSAQLLGDITRATGREVALLRLKTGQRVLRLGNAREVSFQGASRVIAHTHPSGALRLSPARLELGPGGVWQVKGDVPALQSLDQRWSLIFGPEGQSSGRLFPQ